MTTSRTVITDPQPQTLNCSGDHFIRKPNNILIEVNRFQRIQTFLEVV